MIFEAQEGGGGKIFRIPLKLQSVDFAMIKKFINLYKKGRDGRESNIYFTTIKMVLLITFHLLDGKYIFYSTHFFIQFLQLITQLQI